MKITSIDIGIQHLGLTICEVDNAMTSIELTEAKLVDIQDFCCDRTTCTLNHDRCFADWMAHVFKKYAHFFTSDKILIERQPPCGLVAIEQLIHMQYRDRTILISPRSVHCHFKCGQLDGDKEERYNNRKKKMSAITKKIMQKWANKNNEWKRWDREHDIADAIAQTMYYVSQRRKKVVLKERKENFEKINTVCNGKRMSLAECFRQYEYTGGPLSS